VAHRSEYAGAGANRPSLTFERQKMCPIALACEWVSARLGLERRVKAVRLCRLGLALCGPCAVRVLRRLGRAPFGPASL